MTWIIPDITVHGNIYGCHTRSPPRDLIVDYVTRYGYPVAALTPHFAVGCEFPTYGSGCITVGSHMRLHTFGYRLPLT